jgi:hypothetical protein
MPLFTLPLYCSWVLRAVGSPNTLAFAALVLFAHGEQPAVLKDYGLVLVQVAQPRTMHEAIGITPKRGLNPR